MFTPPNFLECGGLPPLLRRNPLRQTAFLQTLIHVRWRPPSTCPPQEGCKRL